MNSYQGMYFSPDQGADILKSASRTTSGTTILHVASAELFLFSVNVAVRGTEGRVFVTDAADVEQFDLVSSFGEEGLESSSCSSNSINPARPITIPAGYKIKLEQGSYGDVSAGFSGMEAWQ